jgi:membrane-associated phospholipid phosphatase
VALSLAVKAGWLAPWDRALTEWFQAQRTPALDDAARAVTFFGSSPWTAAVVALMAIWWWRAGRAPTLAVFCLAGASSLLLQVFLRGWVAQWRPDAVLSQPLGWLERYELAGFTSGHAFRSAFLYGWWADALRREPRRSWTVPAMAACGGLVVLVGITRLYLHRHWGSDVLGAWLIAATALAATRAVRRQVGG